MKNTEKSTDIVAVVNANPIMVLTDEQKFDQFYEAMKQETDSHVPDLSTDKGRKEIASLAYKVSRTKTAIDDAGKKLNEDARAKINQVDASRKQIRERLDALRDEARKPLTEWETAEDDRQKLVNDAIEFFRRAVLIDAEATTETLRERIDQVKLISIDEADFQSCFEVATNAKSAALQALDGAVARIQKAEADAAELQRLREEAELQAQKEADAAAAAEAERIAQQKRDAEELRIKEAEAQAEREKQEAIERAAKEAKELAEKAQAERERQHKAELQAERDKASAAEQQRQNEIRQQKEKAEAEQREAAKRAADQEHRSSIKTAAKEALMKNCSVDEPTAIKIVLAILANDIPNTRITF